jgi:hypothetical protein
VGFPIRKSADQSSFAAPHGLSQRITSFIASQRQGIHRMLLRHLIVLMIDVRAQPRRPPSRKSGNHFCDEDCRRNRKRRAYDQKDHLCLPNVPDLTKPIGIGFACCRMSSSRIHSLFTMTNSSANVVSNDDETKDFPGSGGARRDRTDDLKLAKLPLSQLSYGPERTGAVESQSHVR